MEIYSYICCYSICHFCWYNIYNRYNYTTRDHWSISNIFKILAILTNTCARTPTVISLAHTIIFTFTLTCFVISFLIWTTFLIWTQLYIEFVFTIAWNMLWHCFSFIFICDISNTLTFMSFAFFRHIYFWRLDITTYIIFI